MFNHQSVINGDTMNKIFALVSNIAIFLILFSIVSACTTPVVFNNYNVPINLYGGGRLDIKYSWYPLDATVVDYVMSVNNSNNQGLNLDFIPNPSLSGYVSPLTVSVNANEQKNVNLQVNIAGNDKGGQIIVNGKCADNTPISEGTMFVSIDGRGDSIVPCDNSDWSCGLPGQCENCDQKDGCVDGYHRDYWCSASKSSCLYKLDSCTYNNSYCCSKIGGICNNNICVVSTFSINLPLNITNETGKSKSATIKLYMPGTSQIVNTSTINGYGVISSPNATVDFGLEYDSSILNILFRNLNLVNLTGTLRMMLDTVSTTLPDATLLKAYKVSTSLTSFDGSLKFKYASLPFINEQGLAIYKCSSFNTTSNTCNENWVKQSTTRYPNDDIVSTEITSFSVYALGESQITTTTTTTTSTTTTTTSGSSSSDSNSYSGSSYSGGGRYTTTTIRTTTTIAECTCDSWTNLACGESPCDQTQMKQQRTCNPSGCNIESQCVVDDSCNTQQVNETQNETQMASQTTGLFVLPNLSQYTYPVVGIIILAGAGIAVWKLNGRIKGIFPSYKYSSSRSSKKGNVTVNVQTPKYLEVKMVEKPKVEVIKPEEKPKVSLEAKNRTIEEMRNRALEMDKKMKRK